MALRLCSPSVHASSANDGMISLFDHLHPKFGMHPLLQLHIEIFAHLPPPRIPQPSPEKRPQSQKPLKNRAAHNWGPEHDRRTLTINSRPLQWNLQLVSYFRSVDRRHRRLPLNTRNPSAGANQDWPISQLSPYQSQMPAISFSVSTSRIPIRL